MPPNRGQIKTESYYHHAPRSRGKATVRGTQQLIGPDVQRRVAELYESGWKPVEIAFGMQLPRAAVDDIIATYEYRAEMYFKMTRRRG